MEAEATNEGILPDESDVISGLRKQLKTANAAVKTAGVDAIALVERGVVASSLMPEGYEGFADIFATEVDGELTQATANEWLAGRGFTAPSDELKAEAAQAAANLEAVTDLGGAVAAAGNLTPEDTIATQLAEVVTPGTYQSLPDVSEAVSKILNG